MQIEAGFEINDAVGEKIVIKNFAAVFFNNGQGAFTRQTISMDGAHNAVLGDVDKDGDLDVMGCNYTGNPPLRLWRNRTVATPQPEPFPICPGIYLLLEKGP